MSNQYPSWIKQDSNITQTCYQMWVVPLFLPKMLCGIKLMQKAKVTLATASHTALPSLALSPSDGQGKVADGHEVRKSCKRMSEDPRLPGERERLKKKNASDRQSK